MRALRALVFVAAIAAASLSSQPAPAQQPSQGRPQLDYMLQCQGCHGADGTGTEQAGVPTMIGLTNRFLGLPEGRAYLVQVPGVSQAPLDDRAIADLMNWILERYGSGADRSGFKLYDAKEVARYRAAGPIDVVATRARLVERSRAASPGSAD